MGVDKPARPDGNAVTAANCSSFLPLRLAQTKSPPPPKADGGLFSFRGSRLLRAGVRDGATAAIRRVVGVLAPLQASQTEQTQQPRQAPQTVVTVVIVLVVLRQRGRVGSRSFEGRRVRHARAAEQQGQGGDSDNKWLLHFSPFIDQPKSTTGYGVGSRPGCSSHMRLGPVVAPVNRSLRAC